MVRCGAGRRIRKRRQNCFRPGRCRDLLTGSSVSIRRSRSARSTEQAPGDWSEMTPVPILFGTTIAFAVSQDARRLPAGVSRSLLRRQRALQIRCPPLAGGSFTLVSTPGDQRLRSVGSGPPTLDQVATNVRLSPASGEHLARGARLGVEANVRLSPASGEHLVLRRLGVEANVRLSPASGEHLARAPGLA